MDITKTSSPFYSQINQLGLSIKDIVTRIELQPTLVLVCHAVKQEKLT